MLFYVYVKWWKIKNHHARVFFMIASIFKCLYKNKGPRNF